jgi:colanic acid/amylovoran biosynthesis glycosyltransferase
MRVAYFTNQYPAVSHTFIRREIRALESLDVTVIRYALWTSADNLVHSEDQLELKQTRYVLKAGVLEILKSLLASLGARPLATMRMVLTAMRMGWKSDRGLLRHMAFAIEATVLARWSRQDKVEHLHAHFGTNSAAIAMLAGQLSGVPYSFTAHGSEEFEKAILLSIEEKLRRAAFAVCVSSFGRSQFMRWSSPDQWNKIALVHCGLDSKFFDVDVVPPPSAPRLVCVGRLGEHKAQLILVEAVRRLRDDGMDCEVRLVGDGPMRPQVEAAIKRHGLAQQISVTGWVSGECVKAEIVAARAMVLPSFSENMPVVIMEAMALNRPVVSTYIAGIPELVMPGKTGWLVPSSDDIALADALREVLSAPVEKLAAMGAAGRAHVAEHHDALKEAGKLKLLFEGAAKD